MGSLLKVSIAGAPLNPISQSEIQREITEQHIKDRIEVLCKAYNFPYFSLMEWLALKESSMGQDTRCGDEGKSCGLYQYKKPTWELFQKEFQRYDLHRDSINDQIEMTIIALKNGKWNHWTPLKLKYISNPIQL